MSDPVASDAAQTDHDCISLQYRCYAVYSLLLCYSFGIRQGTQGVTLPVCLSVGHKVVKSTESLFFSSMYVCLSQLSVNLFLTSYITYEAKNTSSC